MHPLISGLIVLLILVPVGLAAMWGFLVLINRQQGLNFHDAFTKIQTDPLACSVYFGLRFVAVAYLISSLFSRYV